MAENRGTLPAHVVEGEDGVAGSFSAGLVCRLRLGLVCDINAATNACCNASSKSYPDAVTESDSKPDSVANANSNSNPDASPNSNSRSYAGDDDAQADRERAGCATGVCSS